MAVERRSSGERGGQARRLGILGGSFNPIHHGHLFSAEAAAAALRLEKVLLVPASQSPLKTPAPIAMDDRVAMARLAAATNPLLEVSTIDVDRPPPSYSVDTVALLAERYPEHELYLIMGLDALQDLLEWRAPERLLALCRLFVVARPGRPLKVPAAITAALGQQTARIVLHDMPRLAISSTEIRRRLAAGEPVRYLLPDVVEQYIRQRGLYGARQVRRAIPYSAEEQTAAMAQSIPTEPTDPTEPVEMSAPERSSEPDALARPDGQATQRVVPAGPEPLELARDVVKFASDKGAADILLMDIRRLSIIADYFIICSGDNERQIRAISRGISDGVSERWGVDPTHRSREAQEQAGWVLLDYGSVVVHIFSPQMREYYRLERLWSEAATLLRMQ